MDDFDTIQFEALVRVGDDDEGGDDGRHDNAYCGENGRHQRLVGPHHRVFAGLGRPGQPGLSKAGGDYYPSGHPG